jgi:hypothetical protein
MCDSIISGLLLFAFDSNICLLQSMFRFSNDLSENYSDPAANFHCLFLLEVIWGAQVPFMETNTFRH